MGTDDTVIERIHEGEDVFIDENMRTGGLGELPSAKSDTSFNIEIEEEDEELDGALDSQEARGGGDGDAASFEHFLAKVRKHEQDLGGEDSNTDWLGEPAIPRPGSSSSGRSAGTGGGGSPSGSPSGRAGAAGAGVLPRSKANARADEECEDEVERDEARGVCRAQLLREPGEVVRSWTRGLV